MIWAVVGALVVMTMLGAVASLMLKVASVDLSPGVLAGSWHFWAGALGYGLAAVLNIWVLRHLDLSVVLPATAVTYVWTLVVAKLVLHETITASKVVGVGFILVGVVLISLT